MLTPIIWKNLTKEKQQEYLERPLSNADPVLQEKVQTIIDKVRSEGDAACRAYTTLFDGVTLESFRVEKEAFIDAEKIVKNSTLRTMERVIQQLTTFHAKGFMQNYAVETAPGILCESLQKPIEKVGLYIPGGSAPLVSTVFMLGIPSLLAGCGTRILCSPPQKNGALDPHILMAAKLCGIENIYKIGGAQAIAAMAYGTKTIPKVDKIFGPGNIFVTAAKISVSQESKGAFYDLPAGPSEVIVIADRLANSEFVAADLLSQAEHGMDSQVILICDNKNFILKVIDAIDSQIPLLSRRNIIQQSLKKSRMILVDSIEEAFPIVNQYAPEHLILQVENPRKYLDHIHHAGSVFLGSWSPESAGDYASGTNHVLPTHGFAKVLSGLSVRDFMKTITVQELKQEGLENIADTILELATIEGLDAHANAIRIRRGRGEKNNAA